MKRFSLIILIILLLVACKKSETGAEKATINYTFINEQTNAPIPGITLEIGYDDHNPTFPGWPYPNTNYRTIAILVSDNSGHIDSSIPIPEGKEYYCYSRDNEHFSHFTDTGTKIVSGQKLKGTFKLKPLNNLIFQVMKTTYRYKSAYVYIYQPLAPYSNKYKYNWVFSAILHYQTVRKGLPVHLGLYYEGHPSNNDIPYGLPDTTMIVTSPDQDTYNVTLEY